MPEDGLSTVLRELLGVSFLSPVFPNICSRAWFLLFALVLQLCIRVTWRMHSFWASQTRVISLCKLTSFFLQPRFSGDAVKRNLMHVSGQSDARYFFMYINFVFLTTSIQWWCCKEKCDACLSWGFILVLNGITIYSQRRLVHWQGG